MRLGDIAAIAALVGAMGVAGWFVIKTREGAQAAPLAVPAEPPAVAMPAPPPKVQSTLDAVKGGVDLLGSLWSLGSGIYTTIARK